MMLALLLALTAQDVPASAQGKPDPYRPTPATIVAEPVALFLAGCDSDGDGRTTAAEMRERLGRTTASDVAWRTGIGYIAYSDWAERWLGDRTAVPTAFDLDRNGDGRIDTGELTDRFDAVFARFDANKDGALTRAELLTVRSSPVGRGGEDGRGRRGGRPRR